MVFTLATLLAVAGHGPGLAFHRFWTQPRRGQVDHLYAEIIRKFFAWLALRTVQMVPEGFAARLGGRSQEPALWRAPVLEKWSISVFTAAFSVSPSAASSSPSYPRGPLRLSLVGHVMAGACSPSASSSSSLKGRDFITVPKPAHLSLTLFDPRSLASPRRGLRPLGLLALRRRRLLLTVSAVLPMLPLLRTAGQRFHVRVPPYSALLGTVAAMVFRGWSSSRAAAAGGLTFAGRTPLPISSGVSVAPGRCRRDRPGRPSSRP